MKKVSYVVISVMLSSLLTVCTASYAWECIGPAEANCLACHGGPGGGTPGGVPYPNGYLHQNPPAHKALFDAHDCYSCHCGDVDTSPCDSGGMPPVDSQCCSDCHLDSTTVGSHIPRGGNCLSCHSQKIGVVLITGGISDAYALEWRVGFYDHLFAAWPLGFLAGGPKEGNTCYTAVHYANEAEAFICGVDQGTPIDAFCNEYTGTYPVHSLEDHLAYYGGDDSFYTDCFNNILPGVVFKGSHSTIDPVTLEEITGPHVDDPQGSGIGIADFVEITSFDFMESLYRYPNNQNPSNRQDLKWFYGNDTPVYLAYPPDTPELTNIKDELTAAMPEVTFAFRHGSEGYMKNLDAYGNPAAQPESTETAIHELINDENVDRIIVFISAPDNANITRFGPCWLDENGQGISELPDKTYRQCLDDLADGIGPSQTQLSEYYAYKPWEELLKVTCPETAHLVNEIDPTVELTFTRALNEEEGFELSVLDMVNHTIAKYSIPDAASLKVIVAGHGLSAGWNDALECDSYARMFNATVARVVARIESSISRTGTFEVVGGENEMSEVEHDLVSTAKPFGDVWSTGERIDAAINGTYVNELGQTVDNGTNNFDYIIVIPVSWTGDSTDTLNQGRAVLGNNIRGRIQGQTAYVRDENDADGSLYNAGDLDSEYCTVKVFDRTGWPSVPGCKEDPDCEIHNPPVYKGAPAPDATTVIVTGTLLSLGNSAARTNLTDAAVESIVEAVSNPDAGGYPDIICEDFSDADGVRDVLDNCPAKPNGAYLGTCVKTVSGVVMGGNITCTDNNGCGTGETCQLNQEDFDTNDIGDACECYADINSSGKVDLNDLVIMKGEFAKTCPPSPCIADCNGDGKVDLADLVIMKFQFLKTGCPV